MERRDQRKRYPIKSTPLNLSGLVSRNQSDFTDQGIQINLSYEEYIHYLVLEEISKIEIPQAVQVDTRDINDKLNKLRETDRYLQKQIDEMTSKNRQPLQSVQTDMSKYATKSFLDPKLEKIKKEQKEQESRLDSIEKRLDVLEEGMKVLIQSSQAIK
jgi:prefoldin subunit 5